MGDIIKKTMHSDEEKIRAAYALNMCSVSVSQIIDYNDAYILEQEYDAILNNLNLKQMPKDDALLKIIIELLNTITFFRIQEIKKNQIEKKYQQRIKNAIWSAVPSLSVVVSGNPVAIALSLATQIGTGYMNYRKEKNNALNDKEDSEIELQITAIEQLNALKRELFTTAWRLADEYDFNDEWRLTEKQIKQYNEILMDQNELRKYARLDSISDKFVAYPPFWYFFGHTANYIADESRLRMSRNEQLTDNDREEYYKDSAIVKIYTDLAKKHFEKFYSLCEYNILREDQLTASFALEYVDLLWEEKDKNLEKIVDLIKLAEKMSPNSFDILQLCVISYLKIGKTDDAARLLKILVNEDYNTSTNAKLLSRLYSSKYIYGNEKESQEALTEYSLLSKNINSDYLFPFPKLNLSDADRNDENLQCEYIETQQGILQRDYRRAINDFIKKMIVECNKIWPIPSNAHYESDAQYFNYSNTAEDIRLNDVKNLFDNKMAEDYVGALRDSSFRVRYIDLINDVINSLDTLKIFRDSENHQDIILNLRKKIVHSRTILKTMQDKLENGTFNYNDYKEMRNKFSFRSFTEGFFDDVKDLIMNHFFELDSICDRLDISPMQYLEQVEYNLVEFCQNNKLTLPDEYRQTDNSIISIPVSTAYLDYSILGDGIENEIDKKEKRIKMKEVIKGNYADVALNGASDFSLLLSGTPEFEAYFKNVELEGSGVKSNVLLILDDRTRKDFDLMLAYDGFYIVDKNKIQPLRKYNRTSLVRKGNKEELDIGWPDKYANKNVDIIKLYTLIEKLIDIDQTI